MATFEPWSRRAQDAAPEEARLSRLFGAVEEAEPLSEVSRERVLRRLQGPRSRRSGLLLLRLVAVGVVLGVAGAAAAQWTAMHWLGARQPHEMPPALPTSVTIAPQPALPRLGPKLIATSEIAPPEVTPSQSASRREARVVPSGTSSSAPSSRLGLEASSLEAALSALRGGAPERALTALNRHLREFPNGALELETRGARVDALLLLGRREEARRELATLPLERVGRKQELRLIRAELDADHDCRRALRDFHALNAQALPGAWAERALFGRGACLLKLGEEAAAARDFALYLERYPSGRFAAQVRAQRLR